MAKKLLLSEVDKVNILGKGLLAKSKGFGSQARPKRSAKRPRYDRKKDNDA